MTTRPNLDTLTPELIERGLRALQQAQTPPPQLLELALAGGSASAAEKSLILQDWFDEMTIHALNYQRRAEGLEQPDAPPPTRAAALTALAADFCSGNPDLEGWSALYHRYLAPLSFEAGDLALAAHVVPQQFRRRLKRGLSHLAHALREAEMDARRQACSPPGSHIPAPDYAHLFGVQEHTQRLARQLTDPNGPRFISLEGLGGIGKTALARAVAQRQIEQDGLTDVLWVSARQEWFSDRGEIIPLNDPARSLEDVAARMAAQLGLQKLTGLPASDKLARIQPILSATPYLAVIDNLETLRDTESLLPALHPLAGDTRFLLTSRYTLSGFPYVHIFPVPQLSASAARALLESEMARRGFRSAIPPPAIERLYALIGGLPLALKLVAAQVRCFALADIIADLQRAQRRTQDALYTFIYRRTWSALTDSARHLLLALLPLDPDGEDRAFIQTMSGLTEADFALALAQLLDYSLLEAVDPLGAPRYNLHRLTATFLRTDVLHQWTA
ncbi:MAG: hypothetical protein DRI81_07740 [Chloroflexi bacterium]|nr:MAG: hypothetical protein DRI81_07740 [Chloroflexota bacterium]